MIKYEEQYLFEMAGIGSFSDFIIKVRETDEGKDPHFHIFRGSEECIEDECCIRIDVAEYFPIDGKEMKLRKNEREALCNFLSETRKSGRLTNWQFVLEVWNEAFPENAVDYDQPMPDYTKLPD